MLNLHHVRAPCDRGHTTLNSHSSVGHNNSLEPTLKSHDKYSCGPCQLSTQHYDEKLVWGHSNWFCRKLVWMKIILYAIIIFYKMSILFHVRWWSEVSRKIEGTT